MFLSEVELIFGCMILAERETVGPNGDTGSELSVSKTCVVALRQPHL